MEKNKEYYESIDKRTAEFKDWKKAQTIEPHEPKTQEELNEKHKEKPTIEKVTGAGDVVAAFTKVTGIKALVDAWTPEGEDCGCDERRKAMNKIPAIRHKMNVQCLTVEEYDYMTKLLSNREPIRNADVTKLVTIYERVFNVDTKGSCKTCSFSGKLTELRAVLETYK